MKKIFLVLSFVIAILTAGCASYDRMAITTFEPMDGKGSEGVFKYTALAGGGYSAEITSKAEKIRIDWLEWYLSKNGFDSKSYEITRRETVVTGEASYRIIYTVKAERPN
jgi:hypothetical protein